jgi:hypothetical protein
LFALQQAGVNQPFDGVTPIFAQLLSNSLSPDRVELVSDRESNGYAGLSLHGSDSTVSLCRSAAASVQLRGNLVIAVSKTPCHE